MIFKRKVYDALTEWKEKYSKKYAAMPEGARNNFRSYIKVDFANVAKDILKTFDDIASLDIFFFVFRPQQV